MTHRRWTVANVGGMLAAQALLAGLVVAENTLLVAVLTGLAVTGFLISTAAAVKQTITDFPTDTPAPSHHRDC